MRLLDVMTGKLKEFSDDKIPRYAIASHRWDADELTYQDYIQGKGRKYAGYAKVEAFSKCVRQRFALWYLWIDTICIDKTNSAELSEAITSMYRWYENAHVCIAWLPDVQAFPKEAINWHEQCLWDFDRSVWFTRVWTLQELLAPKLVVFMDVTFDIVIGHKNGSGLADSTYDAIFGKSLNRRIAAITGIPVGVLDWTPSSKQFSAEQRLAWMNGRKTTRSEDRAYAMLGICGVYMYLNYGERDNAMRRLKKEIERSLLEDVAENSTSSTDRFVRTPTDNHDDIRRSNDPRPPPPPPQGPHLGMISSSPVPTRTENSLLSDVGSGFGPRGDVPLSPAAIRRGSSLEYPSYIGEIFGVSKEGLNPPSGTMEK